MKTRVKYLIGDAILFYLTSMIVIASVLLIDYIWESGLFWFITDIFVCATLIVACKFSIPTYSYRIILGYNLWCKLLRINK